MNGLMSVLMVSCPSWGHIVLATWIIEEMERPNSQQLSLRPYILYTPGIKSHANSPCAKYRSLIYKQALTLLDDRRPTINVFFITHNIGWCTRGVDLKYFLPGCVVMGLNTRPISAYAYFLKSDPYWRTFLQKIYPYWRMEGGRGSS